MQLSYCSTMFIIIEFIYNHSSLLSIQRRLPPSLLLFPACELQQEQSTFLQQQWMPQTKWYAAQTWPCSLSTLPLPLTLSLSSLSSLSLSLLQYILSHLNLLLDHIFNPFLQLPRPCATRNPRAQHSCLQWLCTRFCKVPTVCKKWATKKILKVWANIVSQI